MILGENCTGLILSLSGGPPAKVCHGTSFIAADAAIMGFMHRATVGSDAAGPFLLYLAAAAAPLRAQAGRPSDSGKMITVPTPAPKGGC